MKIMFEDGSYLELDQSPNDSNKLIVILCGYKTETQLTMSSSEITIQDADQIIEFLTKWINK
jgi:hypothetical protein